MQALAIGPIFTWSRWQPDRKMLFSSYLLARDGGNVAFDPLTLDAGEESEIRALGGVATILLTNRDHERGAALMRERFGARVLAARTESNSFELTLDGVFDAPSQVLPGVASLALEGAKTPGEVAFVLDEYGVAIVGDALLGTPAGALSFLPDEKLADRKALAISLRQLWALQPQALLLGDGMPLFAGVRRSAGRAAGNAGRPGGQPDQSRRTGVGVVRRRRWALPREIRGSRAAHRRPQAGVSDRRTSTRSALLSLARAR